MRAGAKVLLRLTQLRDLPRLRRSALFDPAWYLESYPDLHNPDGTTVDPHWHYLTHGAAEGRDPGPQFSTSGYWLQGGARDRNPLVDFEARGREGGRQALPSLAGQARAPGAPAVLFCAHQALAQVFGAERSFLSMLDRAAGAGLRVEVVVPQLLGQGYLDALLDRADRVHIVPYVWRRAGRSPAEPTIEALCRIIGQSRAVEVHQNTLTVDAPLIAARRMGVETVVHLRELPDSDPDLCARMNLSPGALRATLLAQADRFIANSAATAGWIDPEGRLSPGRVVILPNAVDPRLESLDFAPGARLRIGMIGSNTRKKGIGNLVAAARIAQAQATPAEFLLIGPHTDHIHALGPLPPNLRVTGYVTDPVQAIAMVDVVVSLSQFAESFGRTVVEAMAAGRPVICHDRGMPPALVGQDGAGLVVPVDDPSALAAAVAELAADRARLRAMSDLARDRARTANQDAKRVPDAALFSTALGA